MSLTRAGEMDDPVIRGQSMSNFFQCFFDDVQGPEGPKILKDFSEKVEDIARDLGRRVMTELAGNDRDEAAGRLKYVGANILILKACAQAAQTTDGRCRLIGLECMAFIDVELKGLRYSLDTYKRKAA